MAGAAFSWERPRHCEQAAWVPATAATVAGLGSEPAVSAAPARAMGAGRGSVALSLGLTPLAAATAHNLSACACEHELRPN